MAYYIAIDKFGNFDLQHYGVKGMKWGVLNEEDPLGRTRSSAAVAKYQAQGMKRTQQLKGGSSFSAGSKQSSGGANPVAQPSGVSSKNVTAINKAAESMPTVPVKSDQPAATKEEKALADKIQDASAAYQTALMKMQMLARVCQSSGISPTASSDYLSARKEVIKAKYELDKLKNEQQQSAVNNPPTYAQQKQAADSEAKEKLATDKAKEKAGPDLNAIYQQQKETLKSYGYSAYSRKSGKTK